MPSGKDLLEDRISAGPGRPCDSDHLFNFIGIWKRIFLSCSLWNSDSLRPEALGLFSMINGMKYSGDWSGLFASVIIVFLPTFILYPLFLSLRKIIGGQTEELRVNRLVRRES